MMNRLMVGVVLACVLAGLAGCSVISSLSGGSVPIGDVDGAVYSRARSAQPLAHVTVVLRDDTGQVLQTTVSNTKGQFAFNNVAPGEVEVFSQQGAQSGQVRFTAQEGVHARVALTVAAVNPHVVKLKMRGSKPLSADGALDLLENEEDVFTVEGEDADGESIPNLPASWALTGDLGGISPDGRLNAKRAGEGELIVQHDGVKQQLRIRVSPRANAK